MTFITMLKDESGASAAEYALILAIVGTGIAGAAVLLGTNIGDAIDGASTKICQDVDGEASLCESATK